MVAAPTRKRIFDLTGEAHYQDTLSRARPGDPVTLIPEPSNQFDANAIYVVTTTGQKLGYLSRSDAANLAPSVSREHAAKIHQLTGGMADYPYIGCRVSISWDGLPSHPHRHLDQEQTRSGKFVAARSPTAGSGGILSGLINGLFGRRK